MNILPKFSHTRQKTPYAALTLHKTDFWMNLFLAFPVTRCPYIEHITNGNRTLEGQAVGQKAYFICDQGFKTTNGSTTLVCLESGKWNSTAPDCVKGQFIIKISLFFITYQTDA